MFTSYSYIKIVGNMYIYLTCVLSSLYTYVFSLFDFRNPRRWRLLVGPTHDDDDRVCLVFRWEGGGVVGDFLANQIRRMSFRLLCQPPLANHRRVRTG